jgi:hypothetical protein
MEVLAQNSIPGTRSDVGDNWRPRATVWSARQNLIGLNAQAYLGMSSSESHPV